MTNPSNAVGTNGAYGGRTSVDALNDVLGAFSGAGVLEGWNVRANSGMTVMAGGQSGVRDVAIAQDQLGDRTTVNNRLGSPVNITLSAASPSIARVDSIVLYVNKPASVSTTTIDNPGACGIIAVNGTTTAPSEADIRSAITADGGTGATAYYVVIADITIPASATVITGSNITNYSGGLVGTNQLADDAINASKVDWASIGSVMSPSGVPSSLVAHDLPGSYTKVSYGSFTMDINAGTYIVFTAAYIDARNISQGEISFSVANGSDDVGACRAIPNVPGWQNPVGISTATFATSGTKTLNMYMSSSNSGTNVRLSSGNVRLAFIRIA